MGQQANNRRRATLDEQKQRAAGRQNQNSPQREAIKDSVGVRHGKNQPVSGAHGKGGKANRKGGSGSESAGAHAAPINVGRSTKSARRRT